MNKHSVVRQIGALTALATAAALALSGCSGGTSGSDFGSDAPQKLSGTVSLWHFFNDREAKAIAGVVADFEKKNPDVKVKIHSGQDDEKLAKVIASGGDIDVAISASTDSVGLFCSSGSFRDLSPVIKRDGIDMSQLTDVAKSYTSFNGKQCAMPMLADVYGLYYNTDLLAAAGITTPPKTLSELTDMAIKLTTYNADGSIKTLGFNPIIGSYENTPVHYGPAAGAKWIDGDKSAINSPQWKELMTWQKDFVDRIGYDKLQAFTAGLGDEWSADNAFQSGQVAMAMDGEWRVAFLADQKPDLKYATAPFPVADSNPDLYGGGYTSGTIAGVAKGSHQPELAWALLKYLTLNTDAVVKLANGIKNVPTTKDALASPNLDFPEQFKTFLDVAASPHLSTNPATAIGAANQTTFANYWTKYQSGDGGDLDAGLTAVDKDIDNALALSKAP
ncbi:extracellular solute-binding protein [Parafrigoribacterium mesophilum]|uniref:extracellular solute-binding protein n=1 Tax=Parafrigoribacterium mesophilum TaxID=433646 RepID=UPI0031FE2C54